MHYIMTVTLPLFCSSESLKPFIEQNVEDGSQAITDGWKGMDVPVNSTPHRFILFLLPDATLFFS